jgi:hypothetical protein
MLTRDRQGALWLATGFLLAILLRLAAPQFTSVGSDLSFLVKFPTVVEDKDHPFVECLEDPDRPCRNKPSEKCPVFLPNLGMCRYLNCVNADGLPSAFGHVCILSWSPTSNCHSVILSWGESNACACMPCAASVCMSTNAKATKHTS